MHHLKLIDGPYREDVLRMAVAFFKASPYEKHGIDEEEVNNLISSFIADRQEKTCVVLMSDDKPVGVLAAIAVKNIFNKQKVCAELIWWIEPKHRTFKTAKLMLDAYEYWAKEVQHAQLIQLVSLDETLDKLYKRRGFIRAEIAYMKEVH